MAHSIPYRTVKNIDGPDNLADPNKSDAPKKTTKSSMEVNFLKNSNSIAYTRSSKLNFEKIFISYWREKVIVLLCLVIILLFFIKL